MKNKKEYLRRRTYFIKKNFQARFVIKFCLVVLAGIIISTGVLLLLSSGTLTTSFQGSRLVIKRTSIAILPIVLYTNLITLALITVASIIVTILVSHKVAGPLFRFEKDLQEIGSGNLTKHIKLRKHDQLKDFAESLNEMTDNLHAKVMEIRTEITQIYETAIQEGASDETIKRLERLKRDIETKFEL